MRPGQEVIITGEPRAADTQNLLAALNLNFSPHKVAIVKSDQNADRLAKFAGFTDGLQVIEGQATAHVCRDGACTDSTTDTQVMLDKILGKSN
jgi:uncharacterized protein YyaL (SSP411 family)